MAFALDGFGGQGLPHVMAGLRLAIILAKVIRENKVCPIVRFVAVT
jgi:hypothetical protein